MKVYKWMQEKWGQHHNMAHGLGHFTGTHKVVSSNQLYHTMENVLSMNPLTTCYMMGDGSVNQYIDDSDHSSIEYLLYYTH